MEDKISVDYNIDLAELFPPGEHGMYAYYGRIGQGKTYAMTADIISALKRGQVVYTNYPIDWKGFDERSFFPAIFFSLFGIKNQFYEFFSKNLRRIEVDENFHDKLGDLTDCIVALDEGYVAFDSYEMAKLSMKKRKNVLHTRHFDRSIWYTTQRTNAVHITLRAQTNVFYKITKLWSFLFVVFRRQEFDLGSDDGVDETKAYSTKLYLGKKSIFNSYNTKYLRYGAKASQIIDVAFHKVPYFQRWVIFGRLVLAHMPLKRLWDKKGIVVSVAVKSMGDNSTGKTINNSVGSILEQGGKEEVPF
jgi:hypothetical protein